MKNHPQNWTRLALGLALAGVPCCSSSNISKRVCGTNADCPEGQICVELKCEYGPAQVDTMGNLGFPDGLFSDNVDVADLLEPVDFANPANLIDSAEVKEFEEIEVNDDKIADLADFDHLADSYDIEAMVVECEGDNDCDDLNPCTKDECDKTGRCAHTNELNGTLCTNGELCAQKAACIDGQCEIKENIECKTSKVCHTAACDPQTGSCVESIAADQSGCDDGDPCTKNDGCIVGVCGGTALVCDDDNSCTDDQCGSDGDCIFANVADGSVCKSSDDVCFADDVCVQGVCTPGAALCECLADSDCKRADQCVDQLMCDPVDHVCVVKQPAVICPEPAADGCTMFVCNPQTGACMEEFADKGSACNDGNACIEKEACDGAGKCVGTAVDCDDGNPCTNNACDPRVGCVVLNLDGLDCDDGEPCSDKDVCAGGKCKPGLPLVCSDGVVCTEDTCQLGLGCVFVTVDGKCNDGNPCTSDVCTKTGCNHPAIAGPCDDGNACTTGDTCVGGKCVGGPPLNCNDNKVCTVDSCDPAAGCKFQNASVTTTCTDNNACTKNDHCAAGTCTGDLVNCNDDNPCTTDGCTTNTGCTNAPVIASCDDKNACTQNDQCVNGVCQGGVPTVCADDNNPCTAEVCDPAAGCASIPKAGPCDDSEPCTVGDVCDGGKCLPGKWLDCDDKNPCTVDSCNNDGTCTHDSGPMFQKPCESNNACMVNTICIGAICAGFDKACVDQNPCTTDSCDPATGCVFVPHTNPCSDGSACTVGDGCAGGACKPGPVLVCNDNNVCTTDSCDGKTGCVFLQNTVTCDDGNACSVGDACTGGVCQPGSSVVCDAIGHCKTAGCDPVCVSKACDVVKGCTFAAVQSGCSDGDLCTWVDQCKDGKCVPGIAADCNDQNPCTDDGCLPEFGCFNFPNADNQCNDGDACTTNACDNKGMCVIVDIDECTEVPCVVASCSPSLGCTVKGFLTGPCDDGDPCTEQEVCSEGLCSGQPLSCDDGNPCTLDACKVVSKTQHECEHTPQDGLPCATGSQCGVAGVCSGNTCVEQPVSCPKPNVVGTTCMGGLPCDAACVMAGCDPNVGCGAVYLTGTACDDKNPCTDNDGCFGGACAGIPKVCTTSNLCLFPACDPKTGSCSAVALPNGTPCEDGNKCTVMDTCQDGGCKSGGPPLECIDGNPCTHDACILQGGSGALCLNPNEPDGKACGGPGSKAACEAGVCK